MHEVRSINDLLSQISRGEILLPEFQRGYVWNRNQVRGLMQSLYRKHPTGHLLIWRTYKPSLVRGGVAARDGHSLLLLDGQQRVTTLYVLFKGEAPRFYEGESLFFDLLNTCPRSPVNLLKRLPKVPWSQRHSGHPLLPPLASLGALRESQFPILCAFVPFFLLIPNSRPWRFPPFPSSIQNRFSPYSRKKYFNTRADPIRLFQFAGVRPPQGNSRFATESTEDSYIHYFSW